MGHLRNARLNRLRRVEEVSRVPGVRMMYEFVQQNRHLFRGPVYGPLAVELDLRRPEMAPIVERQCGFSMLLNYCVTCRLVGGARDRAASQRAALSTEKQGCASTVVVWVRHCQGGS